MENIMIAEFEKAVEKFSTLLSSIPDREINTIPFENSWTPAQITDHLLRSQEILPKVLDGNTEAAGRNPEEKREVVKNIFLDFSTKMKSPDFILPSAEPIEKAMLQKKLDEKKTELSGSMRSHDLERLCLDFKLPNIGGFTGLEWGWFIIYHIQRHTHQLQKIAEKLILNKKKLTTE